MTVQDLLDRLEDLDPEAEIRLAHQPSWPLAFHLDDVVPSDELIEDADEEDDDGWSAGGPSTDTRSNEGDEPSVVWLVQGNHPDDSPYAPRGVWR